MSQNRPLAHLGSRAVSVLIVEDEMLTALAASATLSELGYSVVGIAATAEAALRLDADRQPDLVLMDITLRGATDGISTARMLRDGSRVPVLFATAHADAATLKRVAEIEPVGFLRKPYSPQELAQAVATACSAIRFPGPVSRDGAWSGQGAVADP